MSSGAFNRSRYERNAGDIHPIRIQPETLSLTIGASSNSAPAAAIDNPISARVSGGRRGIGLKARTVTFVFDTAPAGFKQDSPITLPWLNPATFDAIAKGSTGTYNPGSGATAVTVLYTSPERIG